MTTLQLDQIRLNGNTQPRAMFSSGLAAQYAEAMQSGDIFPPVTVFYDGKEYWLADGFHRHEAAERAGWHEIEVEIKEGTLREAILYSVGANATHGQRREHQDIEQAITRLLEDVQPACKAAGEHICPMEDRCWSTWSNREIARRCKVDEGTVRYYKKQLDDTAEIPQYENERTFIHPKTGQPTTMNTANIGKSQPPDPESDEQDIDDPDLDFDDEPPNQDKREREYAQIALIRVSEAMEQLQRYFNAYFTIRDFGQILKEQLSPEERRTLIETLQD